MNSRHVMGLAEVEVEVEVQAVLVAKKAELEVEEEEIAHSETSVEDVEEDTHVRLFSTSSNMASTALLGRLRAWW